jgi:hypothetical protein
VVYNSSKFNGFNNYTFLSIIVMITLGKCAHRTPSGVRVRHTCIGLMKSKNFIWKHQFYSWTSVGWTCVSWIPRKRIIKDYPKGSITRLGRERLIVSLNRWKVQNISGSSIFQQKTDERICLPELVLTDKEYIMKSNTEYIDFDD